MTRLQGFTSMKVTFQNHLKGAHKYQQNPYRGARCFFKPKLAIWVNFGGPLNGKYWYIYDHFEHVTAIWYNLCPFGIYRLPSFGIISPLWYVWTKKNLATLYPQRILTI
jgi:hypothetical protein